MKVEKEVVVTFAWVTRPERPKGDHRPFKSLPKISFVLVLVFGWFPTACNAFKEKPEYLIFQPMSIFAKGCFRVVA